MDRLPLYIGHNTILTSLNHGPYMFLDLNDPVNVAIASSGSWEQYVTQVFLSTVKPGMTVLDIGAHCGYFSILAGMLVGPSGAVHSFEPNPFYHKNFLQSVSYNGFNGRVHLNRVALSDERGELTMTVAGEAGTSIVFPGVEQFYEYHEITVPKGLLTDYLPSLKADVIKVDIDGAEPLIMDCLFEIIDYNRNMKIFFEYLPAIWGGHPPLPILQRFVERGFSFEIIQRDCSVVPTNVEELANYTTMDHLDLLITRIMD
ncbi:methyltransferase FkbM [Paenibacillus selenitireducens]|uniref:Methyltransferase FkbM n=1 Tax=Paenibacillus selenitireducens TaxID=1324314 RepID=A0A1T2XLT0_9BACL|nr:FkbM family methyltransferase [Paenibacillus selenitireducens]OPA80623.1 methyltransferase FkbM [Paenibacillus selenitireducens]